MPRARRRVETVSEIVALRTALLELHRELLEAQRIQAERFSGRMSAGEVLQAAAEDLRFDWLRALSELIGDLDEAAAAVADEPEGVAGVVAQARELLAPPDPASTFGARYLQALQDHPGVVLAHRSVTAALDRLPKS
jgi:hypothetical protein